MDTEKKCEEHLGIVGEEMDHDIDSKPCLMADNQVSCMDDPRPLAKELPGVLFKNVDSRVLSLRLTTQWVREIVFFFFLEIVF